MKTIAEFDALFPDEDACKQLLAEMRWPNGAVECPRCGSRKVFYAKAKPFNWVCKSGAQSLDKQTGQVLTCAKNGGYRFSVIARTVFEDTKVKLQVWFKIAYLMLTAKKGISALQLHRVIYGEESGHDYRTTWYIAMRWRAAMRGDVIPMLGEDGSPVEIDETYIGGKDANRHWDKRQHISGGSGKTMVIGAIARKGNVICQAVEQLGFETQEGFVRKAVSTKAQLVATDEHGELTEAKVAVFLIVKFAYGKAIFDEGQNRPNTLLSIDYIANCRLFENIDPLANKELRNWLATKDRIEQIAFSFVRPDFASLKKRIQFELASPVPFQQIVDAVVSRLIRSH